jgi:molybdopterin-synthase adenylyltransferase
VNVIGNCTSRSSKGETWMGDRFARQAAIVPQQRLANQHAVVIGCGAVGRQLSLQLAAIGVRDVTLVDFDCVEEVNITCQGYRDNELGQPKVRAARAAMLEVDPQINVTAVEDCFRPRHVKGRSIFCCVDKISARTAIFRSVGPRSDFWADARMQSEVVRVLTAVNAEGRSYYASTLFPQAEAQSGSCTSRSTIYAAALAASIMIHGFTRWLRHLAPDFDVMLNLLASELTVASTNPAKSFS